MATKKDLESMCQIYENLLNGDAPLSYALKKKIIKQKNSLSLLGRKQGNVEKKKRALQKGGMFFINTIADLLHQRVVKDRARRRAKAKRSDKTVINKR